ncbi:hypothetical protein D9611_012539 [Ephemerocybe angulata]|uniref:Uncharacterized protein n=1 Tax=Ephemerocybe angulata TaxID=980116 RepID=A0A8H5AUW1_9AGAR|nr:hypothetical protein D9611_012539 [Tulosesus angulatus]
MTGWRGGQSWTCSPSPSSRSPRTLKCSPPPTALSFAAAPPRFSLYDHLSSQTLTTLELLLLRSLSHEPSPSVRKKSVNTICDVAKGMARGRPAGSILIDLALDERYEVDVTWGHIKVEPLRRPHPRGPPPVLRVQDSESSNLAAERGSTSMGPAVDDSLSDASMNADSDRPELPSLHAHQGKPSRSASPDTPNVTARTPPTYPPSRLIPIPPIVDHLLSEVDELKEALAVEVENRRRRDVET